MDEEIIYSSGIAHITSTAIYFGDSTYQIANIASMEIDRSKKWNAVAVVIMLVGVGLFFVGINSVNQWRQELIIIGAAMLLIGVVIQAYWPVREIRLSIRMSGSATKIIVSDDAKVIDDIKRAIEYAFSLTPRNSFSR